MKLVAVLILFVSASWGQRVDRTIAVTIDDLPVVSTRRDPRTREEITRDILKHLKKAKVPAIGFVNENKLYAGERRDEQQVELLRLWVDAGMELGNHTFSHRSLNRIPIEDYKADLLKGETITKELLREERREMRYFRHPFLQTGRSMEVKSDLNRFLKEHGYTIAPITFDNADYIFARAFDNAFDKGNKKLLRDVGEAYVPYMEAKLEYWEKQSMRLFDREMSQTLLIHANYINSVYLDELIDMLRLRGYRFVSLSDSLKDEAYRLPDTYLGQAGISWLHRWAREKGRDYIVTDEPKVPEFVLKASGFESE